MIFWFWKKENEAVFCIGFKIYSLTEQDKIEFPDLFFFKVNEHFCDGVEFVSGLFE